VILIREARSRYREPIFRGDALWSMVAFGVQIAVGGFIAVAIGRHFGPEVKGYATLLNIGPTVVAWLFALGIGQASMYFAAGGRVRAGELLTMATAIAPVLGLVAAIAGWIVLSPGAGSPDVALALAIGLVFSFAQLLRDFHRAVLLGLNRVALYAQATIASRIPSAAVVLVAIYALPLPALYFAIPISLAVANGLVVGIALRALRWRWTWSPAALGHALRYGIQSHFGNIAEIGVLRLDQFAVYWLLGPTALGLYSVGALAADFMAQGAQAASYVFFARIAAAGPRGPYLARLAVGASSLVLFAVAVPAFLLADPIVRTVFGPGFEGSIPALRILAFAGVAQGTGRVAVSALRALGSPLRSSGAHAAGLLVMAPLVAWLSRFGIEGVAIGTLVAQLVVAVGAYLTIHGPLSRPAGDRS
jgi:O-antigen/teichoic acid export membrane protein